MLTTAVILSLPIAYITTVRHPSLKSPSLLYVKIWLCVSFYVKTTFKIKLTPNTIKNSIRKCVSITCKTFGFSKELTEKEHVFEFHTSNFVPSLTHPQRDQQKEANMPLTKPDSELRGKLVTPDAQFHTQTTRPLLFLVVKVD